MKTQTSHLILHTEPLADGLLVEAHAQGRLTGADYDVLLPQLDALLADGRKLSFLLILEDFHGWDIEGFWRELKWDEKHRAQLNRIAIVGEKGWQKWVTVISKWIMPGNVQHFDRGAETAARAWLLEA